MDKNHINWDHYKAALAVLEEGSLSSAARALGLTQPTIGRQIEALEKALGVTLFTRSQNGLTPTVSALALRPYAENLKTTTAALERAISAEAKEVRGAVRITSSIVIGIEVLPPILAELRQLHPGLEIELVLSDLNQDLLNRDADIAIRMAKPTQEVLVSRRIGVVKLGLYAHQNYLNKHNIPIEISDLSNHSLIGFDSVMPYMRAFQEAYPFLRREHFSLRVDSGVAQLAAIRAGFGIGICQDLLAKRDENLVHILPADFCIEFPTWIVMHEDLKLNARYKTCFDFLVTKLLEIIPN
ncbi:MULTISPECIES: LysR family transcriptional regulator [unclassified Undibacterium]|uniref:LysR family transcriptional regulator n=1 Tax=unclassified Undibacterium TaxID=2630295 RepID=UPI003398E1CC